MGLSRLCVKPVVGQVGCKVRIVLVFWIFKRYKGYYFYSKSEMKVFVSTHAKFMENNTS